MPRYNFSRNTIAEYRKELEATGSPSGASDEYKEFLIAYAAFCQYYENENPQPIGEDEEEEILRRVQRAAGRYYNAKVGQQHNETRAKRMNGALKIYDMVVSELNGQVIPAANEAGAAPVDMAADRRKYEERLAAYEISEEAYDLIRRVVGAEETVDNDEPELRELQQLSRENDQVLDTLENNTEQLEYYVPILIQTANHIMAPVGRSISGDLNRIIQENQNRPPELRMDLSKIAQWKEDITSQSIGSQQVSNEGLVEYALCHLRPSTYSSNTRASARMYSLFEENIERIGSMPVDMTAWTKELFAEANVQDYRYVMGVIRDGLNLMDVPGEKRQMLKEGIRKLDNFKGTETDLAEAVSFLENVQKEFPDFTVNGPNGLSDAISSMKKAKNDFSEIGTHLAPVLDLQKKADAFRAVQTKVKGISETMGEIRDGGSLSDYETMRDRLNDLKTTTQQLREMGITVEPNVKYDDLVPDTHGKAKALQQKYGPELVETIKRIAPDFSGDALPPSGDIPVDEFITACVDSCKVGQILEKKDNFRTTFESKSQDLAKKITQNIKASNDYYQLLKDLSKKVDKLEPSGEKNAIAQSIERLKGQRKNDDTSTFKELVNPKDLEEIRRNASALRNNGDNSPVLRSLAVLGGPAEEYPYWMQRAQIVEFGKTLDGLMDRLNDATSIFSRNSGEFLEMRDTLKDLQQNIKENPNLLGGSHRDVNFADPTFQKKLNDLKNAAARYFDAKLTQDKNANRKTRFEVAEEIMGLKGIGVTKPLAESVEAVTKVSLINDIDELARRTNPSDARQQLEVLVRDADLIRKTDQRLGSAAFAGDEDLDTFRNTLKGMKALSDIITKEKMGWKTLKDPSSGEIEKMIARRDIIVSRGMYKKMEEFFDLKDEKHTPTIFYNEVASDSKKLQKMKDEILTREGTKEIISDIHVKGLNHRNNYMIEFSGSKKLDVPDNNGGLNR